MRDGPLRRVIKALSRRRYALDLAFTRWILKRKGLPQYRLTGSCEGCGKCCESPTIPVGPFIYRLPLLRRMFIAWQRSVNGFVFKKAVRAGYLLVFECTHFDPVTRLCDSYESRPGICRDYPRNLLYDIRPEFFDECGYRPVANNAEGFLARLQREDLPPEVIAELAEKLHLRPAGEGEGGPSRTIDSGASPDGD